METLLDAAGSGRYGHRDRTLLLMMYRHGLRVTEAISLRWEQLDMKAGLLAVQRLKHGVAARFRVMDPPGFGLMDPPCMGYRRSRGLRVLRVLFLRGKFSGFDAAIGVAGDVDGEGGVLESIPDRIEDDGVGDDFVPVIDG